MANKKRDMIGKKRDINNYFLFLKLNIFNFIYIILSYFCYNFTIY